MTDTDTSRPLSCGCGEASYPDCACNPKPLPWGSGQATFPHGVQASPRAIENEAWVEAVARALAQEESVSPSDTKCDWVAYRVLACAAISALAPLIIKRCAEVCKGYVAVFGTEQGNAADETTVSVSDGITHCAMRIAKDIRAMNHFGDATGMVAAEKEVATVKPDLTVGAAAHPERLWLSAPDGDGEHSVWFEADEGGTEYVRADLADADESRDAALAQVVRPPQTTQYVRAKPKKLTEPQIAYLRALSKRPKPYLCEYRPSNRLLALMFSEIFDGPLGWQVRITDAGREQLRRIDEADHA